MHFRKIVFVCCFLAPVAAWASDALIYAAVYECNADEINQALVTDCSATYPSLSVDAAEALRKWRNRNTAKAKLAKNACESELSFKGGNVTPAEVEAFQSKISNIKSDIRKDFLARQQSGGEAVCIDALHLLETGSGAMDLK
ncbi:hypothetical protein [Massilia eburnea]|uniref:hypothetical protein n=1 Tax=Massilia eburnea TaxID=1776165 RepID=UPI003D6B6A40